MDADVEVELPPWLELVPKELDEEAGLELGSEVEVALGLGMEAFPLPDP